MAWIDMLTAARAEALFTSDLATDSRPGRAEVADAIRRAVRHHGGAHGCAVEVAGEYGEHPETAAPRMRWALSTVEAFYPRQAGPPPPAELYSRRPRTAGEDDEGIRAAG
jgi:hypothetical protein